MSKNKQPDGRKIIALNRKAQHDYFLEERFEAGLMLQGWEVKSLRKGSAQLKESYVIVKAGEAFLLGCHISLLQTTSTHYKAEPNRTRKLLLHRKEINNLIGQTERKGYTVVPVSLYFKKGRVKLEIALARGKKQYDKRHTQKDRDWQRDKQRIMKKNRIDS